MTFNEFKFCCLMFTKAFEGKKYGEVVKGCYSMDKDCIIAFEKQVYFNNRFGYSSRDYLFEFSIGRLIVNNYNTPNNLFNSMKDFLDHFKIPFEDIV